MKLIILINFLCLFILASAKSRRPPPMSFLTYKCIQGHCHRTGRLTNKWRDMGEREHTTLAACRLVCDGTAALWPEPMGPYFVGSTYTEVHPDDFDLQVIKAGNSMVAGFFTRAFQHFLRNVRAICNQPCQRASVTVGVIHIYVQTPTLNLDWDTDESYLLQIERDGNILDITINAETAFGARHALETLSQLTAPVKMPTGDTTLVMVENATISDTPIFTHRGLLIDTARNFIPMYDIIRTIDALSSTKMNVLHWHATDSQSFPLEIKSHPIMTKYGAYSTDKIYKPKEIAQIARYGKSHGIRIILEIDTPSHAGAGWEWGETFKYGNLAVCVSKQPWRDFCIQPPCGQLNPVNPHTLSVLHDIYKDVLEVLYEDTVVHVGGDEVSVNCWNSTPEVVAAMEYQGLDRRRPEDFLKVWADFHVKQLRVLDQVRNDYRSSVIIWSSQLTMPEHIEKYLDSSRFVVQTWVEADSDVPIKLLNKGYRVIISTKNAWYLDHGFWGKTKYHTWRDVYNNRIPTTRGILGGEACMWGEYVNNGNLDSRIWPRAAAIGERLWSNPARITTVGVEIRMQAHYERLLARGILADALTPEWCAQHEGECW